MNKKIRTILVFISACIFIFSGTTMQFWGKEQRGETMSVGQMTTENENSDNKVRLEAQDVGETLLMKIRGQRFIQKTVLSDSQLGKERNLANMLSYLTGENNSSEKILTEDMIVENQMTIVGETNQGNKIYSSATKEELDHFLNGIHTMGAGNSSGILSYPGTLYSTPRIWLDGVGDVYCLSPYEQFPTGDWYDGGTWLNDAGLDAIGFWGFPHNYGGQHGLSDDDAYLRTFMALNAYIGTYNRQTIEGLGDSYINMLLEKANQRDVPNDTYTVHTPATIESHFNSEQNWLETDFYKVTGASGTFWLENLPSDFKMVGEDNVEYSSLGIGSSFKIVTTNLGYTGKINFDVKTDIRPSAGIKFTAPGVQNLFSIIRKDPLPAYSSEAMFKAAFSQIIIEKAVERTDTHKDVANIRHDLSKIKVRIMKKDGKYDKTFNLDKIGFLEVSDLLPGDYTIKEIEAPQGLALNPKEFSVKLEAGKKLIFQLYNQEKVGTIKLIKEIKKTTTEDAKNVTHDFTKVKVRIQSQTLNPVFDKEYYLNKEGTLLLEGMPIGDYTITEIEVPPTMQKTAEIQYVTVMEGKIATAKSTATLINEETVTKIHIKKTLVNPTDGVFTKRYTPDYTKIKIRIHSIIPEVTYDKIIFLNEKGEAMVKDLPVGTYEVSEVAVPDDMQRDTTIHTITAAEHQKVYEASFKNILITSRVQIGKKDNNNAWTPNVGFIVAADILRWEDGTPKIYQYNIDTNQLEEEPVSKGTEKNAAKHLYEQVDRSQQIGPIYTTGQDGKTLSNLLLFGLKNVYVQEVKLPEQGHLYLDHQPKLVKLHANETTYVEFLDIIKEQGQIQIYKENEDKQKVAWYFDIIAQYFGTDKEQYIETIATTSLDGLGRSSILPRNDAQGHTIEYKVCEQKHELYKEIECIIITDEMWNSNKSVWNITITNNYKVIGAELWKKVESNTAMATAKGTEIVWKNKTGEILGTFVYTGDGKATIEPTIRVDKLLDGKGTYIEEVKCSEGAKIEEVRRTIADINIAETVDEQILALNTQQTEIINKATETLIDKVDNGKIKRVPGAELVLIDPKTEQEIHKWIVQELYPEKITGLQKDTEYRVCETLVPAGYQAPKTMCSIFKTTSDGSTTTFNLINEYTELIIHKRGLPRNITGVIQGNQLEGARIGIRLLSRPDVENQPPSEIPEKIAQNEKSDKPEFSYQKTSQSTDITRAFLDAKVGDTVHEFITTNQAQIIKGIPVGFEVEVYEIAAPPGYEIAESKNIIINESGSSEVTLIDVEVELLLAKTGKNILYNIIGGMFFIDAGLIILYCKRKMLLKNLKS